MRMSPKPQSKKMATSNTYWRIRQYRTPHAVGDVSENSSVHGAADLNHAGWSNDPLSSVFPLVLTIAGVGET